MPKDMSKMRTSFVYVRSASIHVRTKARSLLSDLSKMMTSPMFLQLPTIFKRRRTLTPPPPPLSINTAAAAEITAATAKAMPPCLERTGVAAPRKQPAGATTCPSPLRATGTLTQDTVLPRLRARFVPHAHISTNDDTPHSTALECQQPQLPSSKQMRTRQNDTTPPHARTTAVRGNQPPLLPSARRFSVALDNLNASDRATQSGITAPRSNTKRSVAQAPVQAPVLALSSPWEHNWGKSRRQRDDVLHVPLPDKDGNDAAGLRTPTKRPSGLNRFACHHGASPYRTSKLVLMLSSLC